MKNLPDGTIQVEQGDTLSGIYGSNWKELSGYTEDPKKLPIGTILPGKPSSSLGGTLTDDKKLPAQPPDSLAMFRDLLKTVTQRAAKDSIGKGGAALPEGMLRPDQVSGGTFANVLKLTTQQKTRGIADIYKSTIDMLDQQQKQANDNITMMISTGAIKNLDDNTLRKLAESAHIPFEYLKEVRDVNGTTKDWQNFSDQEKRKLEAAGINWVTEDGYKKALDLLYGDDSSAASDMKSQLMAVRGADNYVSPDDYKAAKFAWHRAGLSKREFDKEFEMFVNPEHSEDYEIEGT